MFKKIKNAILSVYDEFLTCGENSITNFLNSAKTFWSGSLYRKFTDLGISLGIAIIAPPVAVGLAATNFINPENTVYAVLTAILAGMLLHIVSLWIMEIIVIAAAFQITPITEQIIRNYKVRMMDA